MKSRILAIVCVMALLLSACGRVAAADQPGNGKWRVSDIAGSVAASEKIRLQDDFAAAKNSGFIVNAKVGDSSFTSATLTVLDRKKEILNSLPDEGEAGELKKFAAFAADWEQRDREGAEPVRKYVEAIEEISSLEELSAYFCDREKNPFCLGVLMPGQSGQFTQDPTVTSLQLAGPDLSLGEDSEYFSLSSAGLEARESTNRMTQHVLGKLGYDAGSVNRILKDNYRFEKKLAGCIQYLPKSKTEEMLMTRDECVAAAEGYPLEEILDAWGAPEDGSYYFNTLTGDRIINLYTESNLQEIKGMLIVHLVRKAAHYLDRETYELEKELQKSRLTEPLKNTPYPEEVQEAQILFGDYIRNSACGPILDRLYVDRYVDEGTVRDLTQITEDIIEEFSVLFKEEEWLSEEGQQRCIEKLDAIEVHVAVPDFDMMDWSSLSIAPKENGGTFFEAALASGRCLREQTFSLCALPNDRSKWNPAAVSTTDVNAFYMAGTNGIYILAGVLTEPVYSPEMSLEQKLAGIGTVVGHEITHGFDKNGARYDKDGLENTWLPFSDQMEFSNRCDKVAEYYRTIRPFKGGPAYEGSRVSGEVTADLGGLRVTLSIASGIQDFDYDAYFSQYTAMWADSCQEDIARSCFETDEHPLGYLRVNAGLQQFEEFHSTYGVKEGDGMYLEKDKRIPVW